MNFERGKGVKSGIGIGIDETYNPLYVGKAFKLKMRLRGKIPNVQRPYVQSLFGGERGHDVLKVLEAEHPNRQRLQELTAFKSPIMSLIEIRFTYNPEKAGNNYRYARETELPYSLDYVYDVDSWMKEEEILKESVSKIPFRTNETTELPIIFDEKLYFIRVTDVF